MRIFLVFAAAFAPTLFAAAPTLKPGQYEIVAEFSVPGQPARMPPQKMQHCYTSKDVEDVAKLVAEQRAAEKNCKVVSSKVAGATLTFTTECANSDGTLTIAGEVTFMSPESFRSVVNMKQSGARDAVAAMFNGATITSTAKRIGECAK
jgi:hypothetical protein